VATFWDAYASAYDRLPSALPSYGRTVQLLCDRAEQLIPAGSHLLDVGCGTGNYMAELASRGFLVTGVDGSDAMLARAKTKSAASATLLRADLEQPLPFADSSFDAVVSVMVMYAMTSPSTFLRELRRVVRDSGILLLITTDDRNLVIAGAREVIREYGPIHAISRLFSLAGVGALNALIDARFGRQYSGFTAPEIVRLAADAGWQVEGSESCYVDGAATMIVGRAV